MFTVLALCVLYCTDQSWTFWLRWSSVMCKVFFKLCVEPELPGLWLLPLSGKIIHKVQLSDGSPHRAVG